MIRDFLESAKQKLLEYVKDATETTLWRKIGDGIGDAGLQIQYWFGALSIMKMGKGYVIFDAICVIIFIVFFSGSAYYSIVSEVSAAAERYCPV